jgi:DNA-binding CsgD family transcriptional regulator
MNFVFTKKLLVALKYAFILGFSAFFFSLLKTEVYIALNHWDTYAAIVAILFLFAGLWLGRRPKAATPAGTITTTGPAAEEAPLPGELLSRRETEVLNCLLQNKTNKQIADELCIELSTLKTHINKIYKKLEVKNRRELLVHPLTSSLRTELNQNSALTI